MAWSVVCNDIAVIPGPQLSHKNPLKPQCTFKWIKLGPNPLTTVSQLGDRNAAPKGPVNQQFLCLFMLAGQDGDS